LPKNYAICRMEAGSLIAVPAASDFWSAIRTADELSVVCEESVSPEGARRETGWRVLKCEGPLDFALTGIMASIADPLADAGVSIFPLATYDTDYVLVKDAQLDVAVHALVSFGHVVHV